MRFAGENDGNALGYVWDLDPGSRVQLRQDAAPPPPYTVEVPPQTSGDGELSPVVAALGWAAAATLVMGMFLHAVTWKPRK